MDAPQGGKANTEPHEEPLVVDALRHCRGVPGAGGDGAGLGPAGAVGATR